MRFPAILAALAVALGGMAPVCAQTPDGVHAILELGQEFFYTGDPLLVRVTVLNEGDKTVANPVKSPVLGSFRVADADGKVLAPQGRATVEEPARPERLSARGFYGAVVDLTEMYPRIREGGRYQIVWAADGLSTQAVLVTVIPKYDPAKEYRAIVETDEGPITIDFLGKQAPIGVKVFIDLANSGYYDGLLVHEIRAGDFVVAGDPVASGVERAAFSFPAEQSSAPVVAGTVFLRPVSPSPPANSSPFVIALRPIPEVTGQVTVIGQVVTGLEVVQTISRRPSNLTASRPYYKPLGDIRIRKIRIEEKSAPSASSGGNGGPAAE